MPREQSGLGTLGRVVWAGFSFFQGRRPLASSLRCAPLAEVDNEMLLVAQDECLLSMPRWKLGSCSCRVAPSWASGLLFPPLFMACKRGRTGRGPDARLAQLHAPGKEKATNNH